MVPASSKEFEVALAELTALGLVEFKDDDLFSITEKGLKEARKILDQLPLKDRMLILLGLNEETGNYFEEPKPFPKE